MSVAKMALVILALFCMGLVLSGTVSAQSPEFKSGASIQIGIPVDFNILAQRAGAIYNVVESDDKHVIWKFTGTTGDWAFVFADGRVVVASTVDFDLAAKDTIMKELNDVIDILNVVNPGVVASDSRNNALEATIYYASEPGIYHRLKYDFTNSFDYTLVVPDCIIKKARLDVEGSEKGRDWTVFGQSYYIDDTKVLSCETCCDTCYNCGAGCTTGSKDVTDKILPGLHKISAKAQSPHSMIFEAITSAKPNKEFVLYGPNYIPWIDETAKSMDLQALQEILYKNSNY